MDLEQNAPTPPRRNPFRPAVEELSREPAVDPGKRFDDALQTAVDTRMPLLIVEDHYGLIDLERSAMGKSRPMDPQDLTPEAFRREPLSPAEPDNRIWLGEQIARMDTMDWAKRIPFSPAGVIEATDLAAACARLRTDKYEAAVVQETKNLSRLTMGIEGYEPPLGGFDTGKVHNLLRDRDVRMVTQYFLKQAEEQQRGMTFGAQVFDGLSYMPAWMIEFSLTGGLAKLGSRTAEEIGLRTLQGYAKTEAGRAVLKAAGWSGGVLTRATLGLPHRLGEEIMERRIGSVSVGPAGEVSIATPPESWATSIVKGWAANLIEVASESSGEGMVAGGQWLAKKAIGRMPFGSRLFDAMRQSYLLKHPEPGAAKVFTDRFFDAAKFDGLVGEFAEEELANILHGIAATQRFTPDENAGYLANLEAAITQDLQLKNAAVVATTLAVPAGLRAAGRAVERGRASRRVLEFAKAQEGALAAKPEPTEAEVAERDFLAAHPDDVAAIATFYLQQQEQEGGTPQNVPEPQGPAVVSTVAGPEARAGNEPSQTPLPPIETEAEKGATYAVQGQGQTQAEVDRGRPTFEIEGDFATPEARERGKKKKGRLPGEPSIWEEALLEAQEEAKAQAEQRKADDVVATPRKRAAAAWKPRPLTDADVEKGEAAREELRAFFETAPDADETSPRTEEEARELNAEAAAAETIEAVNDFAGRRPPTDLPPAPPASPDGLPGPEPTAKEYGFIARLLDRLRIPKLTGEKGLSNKDFREVYKFLQLPDDIRRTFPQFDPVYQVQRARERAKQVLDRVLAERAKPYFDLSDAERKPVDEFLVANDTHPGDNSILGPMQTALAANPKLWAGYKAARTTLDYCKELLLQQMRDLGVEEDRIAEFLGSIENYIPHVWKGDWAVAVQDRQSGKTLYMSAGGERAMVAAKGALAAAYPNAKITVFERTKPPYEMYQDAPAWAIEKMMQQIEEEAQAKATKEGKPYDAQAVGVIRAAMTDLYKSKGFGLHFIRRAETPGWTQDLREPIAGYLTGFAGFLTKMEAGMQFPAALDAVDPRRTPSLYKYATEYIRYVMGDEAHWTRLKPLLYWYYMNANLKTAAVNLSGNLMMAWPVLSKRTGGSMAKLMSAMARTASGRLSAEEKGFLDTLEQEGWLDPKLANEISAYGGNAINRLLTTPLRKGMSFLDWNRMVERFNRQSMAVALFDAGITDPAAAAALIDEAHFHYGKGNRPTAARGFLGIIATFRSYTINQITWIKNEIKAGRMGPVARHFFAWTLVGGLTALPFAGIAKRLYAKAFGRDPEEDAEALLGETLGKAVMRGAPSLGGVSLTGSVSMQDIMPEPGDNLFESVGNWVLGVAGDIPGRFQRVGRDLALGEYARALEDASPEALRNPLAAYRLHHEGATTRSGRMIWDFEADTQLRLSTREAILKAMGFQSDRLAREYDRKALWELVAGSKTEAKGQWADRLTLARQQNDEEAAREILAEIDAYNAKWRTRNRPDMMLTRNDLQSALKSREKPVNWPTRDEAAIWQAIWGEKPQEQPAGAGTK